MEDNNRVSERELENISGGSSTQYYIRYCVLRGDTLERIAEKYRTTADMITVLNPIITDGNVRAGMMLCVPDNR